MSQSELGLLSLAMEIYNPSLTWWPSGVGFSQKQALRQRYECRCLILDTLPGSTGSRQGRRTRRESPWKGVLCSMRPRRTPGAQACWGRKRENAARKLVCLSASSHPSLAEKLFLGAPMPPPFPAGLFHERALRRGVDRLVGELWGTHWNADC